MLHVRQNTSNPMPGEILNAPAPPRSTALAARTLPRSLLYSIFARIGGSGLDTDAFETLRASYRGGFLGKAVAYGNRQNEIPSSLIHSLRWHPVRLISFLDRPYYYGAKKKYLDWITSRHLATGRYDLFHSWSGDCLRTLQVARRNHIPSVLEIPTWHRDGGKEKIVPAKGAVLPGETAAFPKWRARLLLKRKGIQHLLEAWQRLNLKDAELWLIGFVHEEAKPYLKQFWRDNIRVVGFVPYPENYLSQGTVHVFPSQWEGSAKVTYEAAACALPQITTREAGDVVRDGVEGIIVRPGDVDAIAAALEHLHRHPEVVERMGSAARQRVVENFTWDHFRTRLLDAYEIAMQKVV